MRNLSSSFALAIGLVFWTSTCQMPGFAQAMPGQSAPAQSNGGSSSAPRVGRYNIYAYNPRQFLVGWFELLPDGKYRTKAGGTGSYSVGADGVKWLSGPHQEQGFIGEFREDRGGKTHRIVLKKTEGGRDMMIAFNSLE